MFAVPGLVAALKNLGGRATALFALAAVCATLQTATAYALPTVDFNRSPGSPLTHQEVTFKSTSQPDPTFPDRQITSQEWDLDDDGSFDDANGSEAAWTFSRPGQHSVGLRVTESGVSGTETNQSYKRIRIGNRPPVASFVVVPGAPAAGEKVTLLSSSYDPDGFLTAYRWDLDGDGAYDDATGSVATITFAAGAHPVALSVVDDSGDDASSSVIVDVKAGAPGVAGTSAAPTLVGVRLLSPFPVVRVSGIVRTKGIKLSVLSVNAPIGATVSVRCSGRGCPFKRSSNIVKSARQVSSAAPLAPQTGLVRIRRFARKLLRVGAFVRIFVTKPGSVGKYTRLRIRRGRLPARVDRCVTAANVRPFPCPPG